MGKGQDLYKVAKQYIPGGTQLLSKRPEMFLPEQWPAYYQDADGCTVTDMDGRVLTDMSFMGIGACVLGYCDPDVDRAVQEAITRGNMSTLNVPEEVELAKLLVDEMHPWADMVRYARSGGESMAQAVRIARAYSMKDHVLFCGYHGWHDWYLSANISSDSALSSHLIDGLSPKGVPLSLGGLTHPFQYNDIEALEKLGQELKGQIGVIVLETIRNMEPSKEFLQAIKNLCKKQNIPFVVDEITSGFRLNWGGAHLLYGIEPDIAVYAKSISNGYPMAAIVGKRNVMEAAQESFISSTYWTDRIGPAAALATLRKMKEVGAQAKIIKTGKKVQENWNASAEKHGLNIHVGSIYPLSHFDFNDDPLALKTLFTQLMLEKGYLASTSLYISISHSEAIVSKYLADCDEVFSIIADAIKRGTYKEMLKGPICHSGFKRLN